LLFLGPALGPTVGGALIGAGGWRAIFLINVPLSALAAVAVRYVPAALAPGRQPGARFDLPGLILLAVASRGLLLVAAATPLWLNALILACRSVSVGALGLPPARNTAMVRG
jgi:MFS family permease